MGYAINAPIPYKATASCSDPLYAGPYTYAWTFSDGGTDTGQYVTHTFHDVWGDVTATVICTNAGTNGRTATTTHTDAIDLPIVTVSLLSPTSGLLYAKDDVVTYVSNGVSSYSGSELEYTWKFDNVDTSGNETTTHTWTTVGAHTASVVATDTVTEVVSASSATSSVTVYEAGWNERGDVQPYYLRSAITVDLPGGRIMYCGGWENNTTSGSKRCLIFDGLTWTKVADMNYSRTGYNDTKSLKGVYLGDNKVFVSGGQPTYAGSVYGYEIYDIDTDTWTFYDTTAAGFLLPRYLSCPIGIGSGKVYMSHGWTGSYPTNVYIIDTIGGDHQWYAGFSTTSSGYKVSYNMKPLLLSTGEIVFLDVLNWAVIFAQNPSEWTHGGVGGQGGYISQFTSIPLDYSSGGDNALVHFSEAGGFLMVHEYTTSYRSRVKRCDLSVATASRTFTDAEVVPYANSTQYEVFTINEGYIVLLGQVLAANPYLGSVIYNPTTNTYIGSRTMVKSNGQYKSTDLCSGTINGRPVIAANEPSGATFLPEVLIEPSPYF